MIVDGGYLIRQEVLKNRIIITLPQTWSMLSVTTTSVSDRKPCLTVEEEAIILALVKEMFEQETGEL